MRLSAKVTSEERANVLYAIANGISEMIDECEIKDDKLDVPTSGDIERMAKGVLDAVLNALGID